MNFVTWLRSKVLELFGPPDPPDPQAQLRELLERLQTELRTAKFQAAETIHEERRIITERDQQRARAAEAEYAAMNALERGNESSARRHLENKLHSEGIANQLEEQRLSIAERVQGLREAVDTYKLEIERVEREQRTWELRQRTARIRSETHTDVPSTTLSEARSLLQSSEENALREEARAEVRDRVSRAQEWKRLKQSRGNTEVEQEMDRLRKRLGSK